MERYINRRRFDSAAVRAVSVLAGGRRSRAETRRAVLSVLESAGLSEREARALATQATSMLWRSRAEMPEVYYDRIRNLLPRFESEKNRVYGAVTQKRKLENLDAVLGEGIFYYCTEHPDCADDHVPYQGKIYVSRFWKERAESDDDRARIAEYVMRYGIKEAEWVTNGPVWLVKRPNCRHRMFRLDTEAVLSGKVSVLRFTTLRADDAIGRYDFRSAVLEALKREIGGSERLDEDASRAEALRKKWAGRR